MDEQTYPGWQVLHRRVVYGETLSAKEQADYEAGCQELDAQEKLDGNLERLRALRAQIPEATEFRQKQRLLHPLQDDLSLHLQEDETTGRLIGLTATGRFHIAALRLNRSALIVNRQRRQLLALLEVSLEQARAESRGLQEQLAQRELYINYLEERLDKLTGRRELD